MAKKTARKKVTSFRMRGASKPWEVWCRREGFMKSFSTETEADTYSRKHLNDTGHSTTVIGQQSMKRLLFT